MRTIKDIIEEFENFKKIMLEKLQAQTDFWNESTELIENINNDIQKINTKVNELDATISSKLEKIQEVPLIAAKSAVISYVVVFVVAFVLGAILF